MSQHLIRKPGLLLILLLFAGFQLFIITGVHGQDDCASKIQEAQKFYDQGMIDEIPQMLAPCMSDGFSRVQKIEAYKLIILSYLFDDDQFEAERTMLEFLKKNPEYEIMPNDPIEFVYLFESYRTASVFSFGVSAGFNLTDPRIIEPYSSLDLSQATLKNTMKPGFQIGAGIGNYLGRNLLLNVEAYLAMNQYEFSDELKNPKWGDKNVVSSLTYTEKLYKVEFPVTMVYEFMVKNTHCFVRAGFSAAKITQVNGRPARMVYEDEQPETGENEDITADRNSMLYSGIVGAGLRYKVPRGIIKIDLRAKIGFNNIVNSKKRMDNQLLIANYHYRDDEFSLNNLSLSASYYFSFYRPKKH